MRYESNSYEEKVERFYVLLRVISKATTLDNR